MTAASYLNGTELVVSNNTGRGINSQRQALVTCNGCRLEGNTSWAAVSRLGGYMTLWNPVVSGRGIFASEDGSYVDVDCVSVVSSYPCNINITAGFAARAVGGGTAALFGVGVFTGVVTAFGGGEIGVYGGQQISPGPNQVTDHGRLTTGMAEIGGQTTTLGSTVLERFAHAILWDGTQLSGTLECRSGSDAWSDTAYPKAKVINCDNVPIQQEK